MSEEHTPYCAVFVSQKGFLEIQSIILAASLRENLQGNFSIKAAIPENFGKLNKLTYQIFEKLEVQPFFFQNDFCPTFYRGNKPFAANLDANVLFLDSDIICVKPFSPLCLPKADVFCFTEDPYLPYSPKEWKDIANLFQVSLPVFEGLNKQNLNTPIVYFKKSTKLGSKWLEATKALHNAVHSGRILLRKVRKIANMGFSMAVYSSNLDLHVSDPLTWDGSPNWWSYPHCSCHIWEKQIPVSKRIYNQYLCSPDHVYFYQNGVQKKLGLPYFFVLQNGFGYCPIHQGHTSLDFNKIGLSYYPEVRSFIYKLLSKYPMIDCHPEWESYLNRYFINKDSFWFKKPEHYGEKLLDTINRKDRKHLPM